MNSQLEPSKVGYPKYLCTYSLALCLVRRGSKWYKLYGLCFGHFLQSGLRVIGRILVVSVSHAYGEPIRNVQVVEFLWLMLHASNLEKSIGRCVAFQAAPVYRQSGELGISFLMLALDPAASHYGTVHPCTQIDLPDKGLRPSMDR